MTAAPAFRFDNSYARELPGFHVPWSPAAVPAPALLFFNRPLAEELGLDADALDGPVGAAVFSGQQVPDGAEPIAQVYAGHQFGRFSPQLGDGRALLLGELIDLQGRRRDLALKGSGRTPFARGGDGKALVGPMLREALLGEAMHALGVPTTRALAVAGTGEAVRREGAAFPGAVLARVAASHLRVGTFQYFAARGEVARVRQLVAYAAARHDPAAAAAPVPALALLQGVVARQAGLLAQWMSLGFIHGVMNTDNTTISGETIDYGPCAFLEAHDPAAVFSSIDHGGRYAYGNQPAIVQWNLARLAEALLPLIADPQAAGPAEGEPLERAVQSATEAVNAFGPRYLTALAAQQRVKLGLAQPRDGDAALADEFLALLHAQQADHTGAWRALADAALGDANPLRARLADPAAADAWLARWQARCAAEDAGADPATAAAARAARLRAANPRIVPRNHRVEEALSAAMNEGDLAPFTRLLAALRRPFDDAPELDAYAQPAPPAFTAGYQTFCGT